MVRGSLQFDRNLMLVHLAAIFIAICAQFVYLVTYTIAYPLVDYTISQLVTLIVAQVFATTVPLMLCYIFMKLGRSLQRTQTFYVDKSGKICMKDRGHSTSIANDVSESFISDASPPVVTERIYSEDEFVGEYLRESEEPVDIVGSPRVCRSLQLDSQIRILSPAQS